MLGVQENCEESFVFKHVPEDFRVLECSIPSVVRKEGAKYVYYRLQKRGFTTQASVELVAKHLSLSPSAVSYAGRKDEDGVTTQYIAIPLAEVAAVIPAATIVDGIDGWIRIEEIGYGNEPLKIGELDANAFHVIVRNLSDRCAHQLAERGRLITFCLNYYDTQRFGVPRQPKVTHLIGQEMHEARWDQALGYLIRSGTPESVAAAEWQGSPEVFFRSLDFRVRDFFLAAFESYRWNEALKDLVRETCSASERISFTVDGLDYLFAATAVDVAKAAGRVTELPYFRYDSSRGDLARRCLFRPTVVQAVILVGEPQPDAHFPGQWSLPMRFTLHSGCYATMVLRQVRIQYS